MIRVEHGTHRRDWRGNFLSILIPTKYTLWKTTKAVNIHENEDQKFAIWKHSYFGRCWVGPGFPTASNFALNYFRLPSPPGWFTNTFAIGSTFRSICILCISVFSCQACHAGFRSLYLGPHVQYLFAPHGDEGGFVFLHLKQPCCLTLFQLMQIERSRGRKTRRRQVLREENGSWMFKNAEHFADFVSLRNARWICFRRFVWKLPASYQRCSVHGQRVERSFPVCHRI